MANTQVRIYHDRVNQLLTGPTGPVAKDLARRAIKVDRTAKQLCPYLSGRLRSSINWQLGTDNRGLFATIGTDVHYAPYVELGTSRMAAQPFLRPALQAAK